MPAPRKVTVVSVAAQPTTHTQREATPVEQAARRHGLGPAAPQQPVVFPVASVPRAARTTTFVSAQPTTHTQRNATPAEQAARRAQQNRVHFASQAEQHPASVTISYAPFRGSSASLPTTYTQHTQRDATPVAGTAPPPVRR